MTKQAGLSFFISLVMFTFLRHIRKSLIESGSARKYILYTIGEIALVVIGILIALQINNWNIERLNAREEERILYGISQRVEFNRFQHNMGVERYKEVLAAGERQLIKSLNDGSPSQPEEAAKDLHSITKRFLMGANNSTHIYDELIGSGQLGLISSRALRERITTLKVNLELLASYEVLQSGFVDDQLIPYLNRNVNRLAIFSVGSQTNSSWYDEMINWNYPAFDNKDYAFALGHLYSDPEFVNLLFELMNKTNVLMPIYERIEDQLYHIDSLIQQSNSGWKSEE